jgi:REP element-mobilizing transposase RayT
MRKARKVVQGAHYHVTARANRREFILNSPEMKELFLTVLKRAKGKYKFKLTTFCIMGNHIHFMMKPDENENLSRIMQWILAAFAVLTRAKSMKAVIELLIQEVGVHACASGLPAKQVCASTTVRSFSQHTNSKFSEICKDI